MRLLLKVRGQDDPGCNGDLFGPLCDPGPSRDRIGLGKAHDFQPFGRFCGVKIAAFKESFHVAIPDGIDFGGLLLAQQVLETRVLVERNVGVVLVVGKFRFGIDLYFFAFG